MHHLELHLDNFKDDFLKKKNMFAHSDSSYFNSYLSQAILSILTNHIPNGKVIYSDAVSISV